MNDAAIMVLVLFVLGAGIAIGATLWHGLMSRRIDAALLESSQLDRVLAAASHELNQLHQSAAGLREPVALAEDAHQVLAGGHEGNVAGHSLPAANDAYAAFGRVRERASKPESGLQASFMHSPRAGAPKRTCSFCARVRAALGLR